MRALLNKTMKLLAGEPKPMQPDPALVTEMKNAVDEFAYWHDVVERGGCSDEARDALDAAENRVRRANAELFCEGR